MTQEPTIEKTQDTEGLERLLDYLRETRGFDFTAYKRGSLERRIQKRMSEVGAGGYDDYLDQLEVNPAEFTDLFNTILINVTGFFRDQPAWDHIASEVIPALLESNPGNRPIRVWSAACASGEEAYTVAILLAEAMGDEAFRRRVKIYATDVDDDALAAARSGTYTSDQLNPVPEELRSRYFDSGSRGHTFRSDLRRSVIFGRNDLVQDAPISRVDLLLVRNALMYFTPEAQSRILGHLNFALRETGFLFVGKSEMLITHSDLFAPVNLKWRVFRKVPRAGMREALTFPGEGPSYTPPAEPEGDTRLRDGASDAGPVAQIVVDRNNVVTMVNQRARLLLGLSAGDVGRPLQDLEISYRPVELRSAIAEVYKQGEPKELGRVTWEHAGDPRVLDIQVVPLADPEGAPFGASVSFDDVTEYAQLDEEHARSTLELEKAYELLQSTVEELETTNEELQSTNEELETMNEELQSTNDELETMNDEHREHSRELDRVNLFLEGILSNLGQAVIVLDPDQHVQLWNPAATDYWGLRAGEVAGQHILKLDFGLPVDELKHAIRAALSAEPELSALTLEAVNRRGKSMTMHVRVIPLLDRAHTSSGVVILMSDRLPAEG